jgi:crotonobetainyl-CoA:carnitine CoA-transferase CaiB-like acyl-CoA transferase|tara:strand:- start:15005 stop:16054 length:1050 start_codon:yes stop_codon:yes gene_type:complete
MLLSDQGAEVVRIDSPKDYPMQFEGYANSVWNRGKQSFEIDVSDSHGKERFFKHTSDADVIIYDKHPDCYKDFNLSYNSLAKDNPRLICVSLPGFPKGHTYEDLPPDEGIVASASGIYSFNPSGELPVAGEGPSFHGLSYASTFAAITASTAVVAALYHREKHGIGQQITVPVHDAMYQGMGTALVRHSKRSTGNQEGHPVIKRFYQCKDGRWINVNISLPRFLKPFLESIDHIEWLEQLTDTTGLLSDETGLNLWVNRFTEVWQNKTALEWENIMDELGIPGTMCRTIDEWLDSEQSVISGATITIDDPIFGKMKQAGKIVRLYNHDHGNLASARASQIEKPPPEVNR